MILTDDEIYGMYNEPRSDAEMVAFAREVEAAVLAKLAAPGEDDTRCPTCGEDGGTSCGAVGCGLLTDPLAAQYAKLAQHCAMLEAKLAAVEKVEPNTVTLLPDGSAFGMMTFPLPADHWLYREREYATPESTETVDLPPPFVPRTVENKELVRLAARWAIRASTNCGKENDFDPDAMVQNFVYATLGPYPGCISSEDTHPAPKPKAESVNQVLLDALNTGLQYAEETLIEHDQAYGHHTATKGHRDLIKSDIAEIRAAIAAAEQAPQGAKK